MVFLPVNFRNFFRHDWSFSDGVYFTDTEMIIFLSVPTFKNTEMKPGNKSNVSPAHLRSESLSAGPGAASLSWFRRNNMEATGCDTSCQRLSTQTVFLLVHPKVFPSRRPAAQQPSCIMNLYKQPPHDVNQPRAAENGASLKLEL